MPSNLLTATEAARNFSEVLDRVSHKGASYDIRRGREVVARIVPARPAPSRISVPELEVLLQRGPRLSSEEAGSFEKDVAALRRRLRPPRDPWR